ncbi:uncharacterized protein LOC133367337 [Rhineura floridana]|uniref:uncharacterized protein LOC133367337 n=1 Tax=Rhineura floridana TaxID=261503 RepID=UPI002AC7F82B|nr:uncharacterized protein LOC133367337 [Rhineura floridana]
MAPVIKIQSVQASSLISTSPVSFPVLLHIVLQTASSAAALHPPKLSVQPQYPVYFEDERLVLICSAFPNMTVEGYRFFNQDGQQIFKMVVNPYQKGRLVFNAQMNNTGNYSCDYWLGTPGTEVTSPQRDSISLLVKEAPAAPSLSLNPQRQEYSLEDSISLVCSAPPEMMTIKEFRYYSDRMSISTRVSHSSNYTLNKSIRKLMSMGPFRCAYALHIYGRNVLSKKSNPVTIVGTGARWGQMLAIGGTFFAINGLIFLISHWCF